MVAPAPLLYVLAEQTVGKCTHGVGVGVWARFRTRPMTFEPVRAARCARCLRWRDVLVQARVAPAPKLEKPTAHVQVFDSARLVLFLGQAVQLAAAAALNVLAPHAVARGTKRAGVSGVGRGWGAEIAVRVGGREGGVQEQAAPPVP